MGTTRLLAWRDTVILKIYGDAVGARLVVRWCQGRFLSQALLGWQSAKPDVIARSYTLLGSITVFS